MDKGSASYSGRFTQALLDRLMFVGDPLADSAVAALHERAYDRTAAKLAAVRDCAAAGDHRAKNFLESLAQKPNWIDASLIARAQGLSLVHYRAIQMSLMHSLFAGALFARATLVTQSTGRLGGNPATRIKETAAFVAAVLQPGALEPGGLGFETTVRVRLLHASIRVWLARSPGFSESYVGVPIDQTMLAMTLGLFSYLNIRSLQRLGVRLSEDDVCALHHFWRAIGWILGVGEELATQSLQEEKRLWSALVAHQTFPDLMGEAYLNDAVATVAKMAGAKSDIKPFIRSLYLYLSGPAWFGMKGLERMDPRLSFLRASIGAQGVLRRWLPSLTADAEGKGRSAFAKAASLAASHDFDVKIETPENIEKSKIFMEILSAGVRQRFAHLQGPPPIESAAETVRA